MGSINSASIDEMRCDASNSWYQKSEIIPIWHRCQWFVISAENQDYLIGPLGSNGLVKCLALVLDC